MDDYAFGVDDPEPLTLAADADAAPLGLPPLPPPAFPGCPGGSFTCRGHGPGGRERVPRRAADDTRLPAAGGAYSRGRRSADPPPEVPFGLDKRLCRVRLFVECEQAAPGRGPAGLLPQGRHLRQPPPRHQGQEGQARAGPLPPILLPHQGYDEDWHQATYEWATTRLAELRSSRAVEAGDAGAAAERRPEPRLLPSPPDNAGNWLPVTASANNKRSHFNPHHLSRAMASSISDITS